jgi:phasin family protein
MSEPTKITDAASLAKAAEDFALEASRVLREHQGASMESARQMAQEWMHLAEDGLKRNLALLTELAQARSAQTAVEIQSRIVRENMDTLMKDSARLAELISKANQDAAARLSVRRAVMSRIAHQGEPPDYGADNETG